MRFPEEEPPTKPETPSKPYKPTPPAMPPLIIPPNPTDPGERPTDPAPADQPTPKKIEENGQLQGS